MSMPPIAQDPCWTAEQLQFCEAFIRVTDVPKYILGRNLYANAVGELVNIQGFIDDFAHETEHFGRPILRSDAVPRNALVLNASGGRPLTAQSNLTRRGLRNSDYFSFARISKLPLPEIRFNEGFKSAFRTNQAKYESVFDRLEDSISKELYLKLLRFRYQEDIRILEGLTQAEDAQYFEDFLGLNDNNEVFVDVGCYDGFTSTAFARLYPQYKAIHAFEPDPLNFGRCAEAFKFLPRAQCYKLGLSSKQQRLTFDIRESASSLSASGNTVVDVNALDNISIQDPTFIKMDIEGAEIEALAGAHGTISKHHPVLAISVYHNAVDMWRIPEAVFSIRSDYDIKLRHYTECIYETVMFFLPR
jgi:FkbM family methyltransferase